MLKFITAAEQVPAPKTEVSSCMTLVPHDDVHRLNEPFALLQHLYISIGFLAELFTAYYGRNAATYSVKSRIGLPDSKNEPKP